MERIVVSVLLIFSCSTNAQPSGSGSAMGSGSGIIRTACLDAGYTSCCPGRNDSCSTTSQPKCYCDAFCLLAASDDCCEDLMMGLLPCSKFVISIAIFV